MDRETAEVPPEATRTTPGDNGHEKHVSHRNTADSIWVVNNRDHATLRSRFYKSLLLGISGAFQLTIAGEILASYGPLTFIAFTTGIVICASIAAQEMGALLSAIDLNVTKLKEALFDPDEDDEPEQRRIDAPPTGART